MVVVWCGEAWCGVVTVGTLLALSPTTKILYFTVNKYFRKGMN